MSRLRKAPPHWEQLPPNGTPGQVVPLSLPQTEDELDEAFRTGRRLRVLLQRHRSSRRFSAAPIYSGAIARATAPGIAPGTESAIEDQVRILLPPRR